MLGEFLTRLAIALPLVCAAAVLCLLAVKRGWFKLPSFANRTANPATPQALEILGVKSISPTARVAVVRFDGRTHLIGVSAQQIALIASAVPEESPPCTS